jgi:hypothetical protein
MALLPQMGTALLATAVTTCPVAAKLPAPPTDRGAYAMTVAIGVSKKIVHGSSRVSFTLDHPK